MTPNIYLSHMICTNRIFYPSLPPPLNTHTALHSHHNHHSHTHESDLSDLSLKVRSADEGPINNLIPNSAHVRKIKALSEEGALPGSEEGLYSTDQLQFMMGFSLILGFVFMLLIDQCSGGHAHSIPGTWARGEGVVTVLSLKQMSSNSLIMVV